MSTLVQSKINEALQLMTEAHSEEAEGSVLAEQISQLTQKSAGLLTSAREKRVIATSQLEAAQTLNGGVNPPSLSGAEAAATSTAPTKRRGGRPKGSKAAIAAAASSAGPSVAKAKATKASTPKVKKATLKVDRTSAEEGHLPPLHERLKTVIGGDDVSIAQAIERLKAHDKRWVPKSEDLKAYISLVLSTHTKDLFDRVSRGVYCVKKVAQKRALAAHKNGAQVIPNGIEDFGSNVLESPFSGAAG